MRRLIFCASLALVLGCPVNREPPSPTPNPVPDSELCGAMCAHLGAGDAGLGCEEGKALYNSDLPGPRDVPNQSCEDWCKQQQGKGVFINPRCVMQVKACAEIEPARQSICH